MRGFRHETDPPNWWQSTSKNTPFFSLVHPTTAPSPSRPFGHRSCARAFGSSVHGRPSESCRPRAEKTLRPGAPEDPNDLAGHVDPNQACLFIRLEFVLDSELISQRRRTPAGPISFHTRTILWNEVSSKSKAPNAMMEEVQFEAILSCQISLQLTERTSTKRGGPRTRPQMPTTFSLLVSGE